MLFRSVVRDVRDSFGSLSRRSFDVRLLGSYCRGKSHGSVHELHDQPEIVQHDPWANLPPELLRDVIKRLESLLEFLQGLDLSFNAASYFMYQLLRGLKYVHSENVLHRDLKPSNLLLNANCDLKICDFGLSRTTSETDFMTEYVVRRWYRAPELLLNCSEYTGAIDIWSVGCIVEIMVREPLFPGKDYVHQLGLITELLESPKDSDIGFLRSDNARKYIKKLNHCPKQQFLKKFPNMPPLAADLAERMLVFDPSKRLTVEQALNHPYLISLHEINEEPTCPSPFRFDFEQSALSEADIKELIWKETLAYNAE